MKRTYKKPEFYYENFALLDSIAGCDLKSNFTQAGGCVAYWDEDFEGWVFADSAQGCDLFSIQDNRVCLNNPTPGFSIHSS